MQVGNFRLIQWAKSFLLTTLIFGVLLYVVFKVNVPDPFGPAIFLVLILPAVFVFAPFILMNIHNAWGGFYVLSIILNWFVYTWFVHWLIVRRRRNRQASSKMSSG
jgi:hypothetical protein